MGKEKPCTWNGVKYSSVKAAAKANNISPSAMGYRLSKGWVKDEDCKVFTRWDVEDIRERHAKGQGIGEIADYYAKRKGYPRNGFDSQIAQILKGITYTRFEGQTWETHELNRSWRIFTQDEVIDIRRRYKDGLSTTDIANEYESTYSIIKGVLLGKNYTREFNHIEAPIKKFSYKRSEQSLKITKDERQAIYNYYQKHGIYGKRGVPENYITMKQMADYHGVDISLISRIAKGER